MTLLDTVALVAGSALAFSMLGLPEVSLRPRSILDAYGAAGPPAWVALLVELPTIGMPVGFALSCALLARRARDGDMPRAVEWATLLVGLSMVVLAFPPDDIPQGTRSLLIGYGGVLVGLIGVVAARDWVPRPWRGLMLVALLWLLIWWPATASTRVIPNWVWSGYSTPIVSSSWPFRLHHAILTALGLLPLGVIAAVPLVATVRNGCAGWSWIDWSGGLAAFLLVPSAFVLVVIGQRHYIWQLEPFVLAAWVLLVPTLALALVWTLSPAWNRWFWTEPVGATQPLESTNDARS